MTGHPLTADLSGCPAFAAAMTDPLAAHTWPARGAVTLDAFMPKYVQRPHWLRSLALVPRGSHGEP